MIMNVINSNDLSTLALICSQVIQKLTPPNNGNPFAFENIIACLSLVNILHILISYVLSMQ